jgi:hypothetical protein
METGLKQVFFHKSQKFLKKLLFGFFMQPA